MVDSKNDRPAAFETFLRDGAWREAAELAGSRGDDEAAAELFAKLGDWAAAADAAMRAGRLLAAMVYALKAGSDDVLARTCRRMLHDDDPALREALELLERAGHLLRAAEIAEAMGELERALRLYASAHEPMQAARLAERMGNAGLALRHYLDAAAGGAAPWEARAGVARSYQQLGMLDEALSAFLALQRASGGSLDEDHQERFALCLHGLGWDAAAVRLLVGRAGVDEALREDTPSCVRRLAQRRRELAAGPIERFRLLAQTPGLQGALFVAQDIAADAQVWVWALPGTTHARQVVIAAHQHLAHPPTPGVPFCEAAADQSQLIVFAPLRGTLLATMLDTHHWDSAEIRGIARQLARILTAAHERGIVHGALTPWSIWLHAGEVTVAGFEGHLLLDADGQETETLAGQLRYLAPEVMAGAEPDYRADLYGVGACVWAMVWGGPPSLSALAPPADGAVRAGRGLDEVLGRLLRSDPARRPSSMREAARRLEDTVWDQSARPATLRAERAGLSHAARYTREALAHQVWFDTWLGRFVRRLRLPSHGTEREWGRLQRFAQLSDPKIQRVWHMDKATRELELQHVEGASLSDLGALRSTRAREQLVADLAGAQAALIAAGLAGLCGVELYVDTKTGQSVMVLGEDVTGRANEETDPAGHWCSVARRWLELDREGPTEPAYVDIVAAVTRISAACSTLPRQQRDQQMVSALRAAERSLRSRLDAASLREAG